MYFSKSLIPILKNNPSEAKIKSHQLMLRTGMIKQSSAGRSLVIGINNFERNIIVKTLLNLINQFPQDNI